MSDLFINSNNLPFIFNPQNQDANLMNNFSNGLAFNTFENKNFCRPLNMPFNTINQVSMYQEPKLLTNNIIIQNNNNNIKKNNFEVISTSNKLNNDLINKDFKNPNQNKIHIKPFVTNSTLHSNGQNANNHTSTKGNKEFLNKIRRRSIKNNKIVFVHSLNGAARKVVNEAKVLDILKQIN